MAIFGTVMDSDYCFVADLVLMGFPRINVSEPVTRGGQSSSRTEDGVGRKNLSPSKNLASKAGVLLKEYITFP